MKRSRLLLTSIIFILIALFATVPLLRQFAYGAQNLSADSVSDLNGYYVNGGSSYDALSDGDICFVFKAGSDREFVLYIYDEDSGQTEDSDMYVKPDYYSSGRSYTGTGRWVKMSFDAYNQKIYGSAIFEGSTIDGYETTFSVTDPTADRTITIPNSSETIGVATSIQNNLIKKSDFADQDWGDVSVDSNVVNIDPSTVGNTEIDANATLHISGLGIGDSSPDAPLEILSTTAPQFRITNTDGVDDMDISVDSNGDVDIQISGDNLVIQNDTDGVTGFQVLDADGGTPIFNVDTTNEKVGIGVSSPSSQLEVNDRILISQTMETTDHAILELCNRRLIGGLQDNDEIGVIKFTGYDASAYVTHSSYIACYTNEAWTDPNNNGSTLYFYTRLPDASDSSQRASFDDSGLLVAQQGFKIGSYTMDSSNFRYGSAAGTTGVIQLDGLNYNYNLLTLQASNQTYRTYGIGMSGNAGLCIYDNFAEATRIYLSSTGKLGIGPSENPSEELEVEGEAKFETGVYSDTNDRVLTTSECRNTFWSNQGAGDAQTFTLASADAGLKTTIGVVDPNDVNITPASGDQILVLTDSVGDSISSDSAQGSYITLLAIDSTYWFPLDRQGTWTDID